MIDISLLEIAIIALAIGLGSFIKGATGTGLPLVAVPVMATFLGVERAVVVMVIPGIATNVWMLWQRRAHLRGARDLPVLLGTGGIGAVVGTWGLRELEGAVLSLLVAAVVVLYVVVFLRSASLQFPAEVTRYTSWPVGLAAGGLQGATGMSGPLLTTYLHGFRLQRDIFIVSIVTLFLAFAVVQGAALAQFGMFTPSRAVEGVLALAPIVAMPLGTRVARRFSRRTFDLWVLAVLVGAALKLMWDGVGALLS